MQVEFVGSDMSVAGTTEFAVAGDVRTAEYVPMMFHGTPGELAAMFDGGVIPKAGDVIGDSWVCFETSEVHGQISVKCRWRVSPATAFDAETIARAAGFTLESWATNPPKPAMWHGTPEALRNLVQLASRTAKRQA